MRTLVGSRAIKYWFPDFREPDDWDFQSNVIGHHSKNVEIFWHDDLLKWPWGKIATADEMYTMKVSHIFWDVKWEKHIRDVMWLKNKGCNFLPELYDILYPIWCERYGNKKAYLTKTKEEFFTRSVTRVYDHDSIHAAIAYYDEPMYLRILQDGQEVAVDKAKFDALSYDDKCKLVREEVYATALERKLMPDPYGSPRAAYAWALKNTIVSLSKGWFPLWIVLNFQGVNTPDINYLQKLNDNKHKLVLMEDICNR